MGEKEKSQDDFKVSDLNNLKNGTTPTQKLGQATGRTGLQRKIRNSALVYKSEVSFTYSSQESRWITHVRSLRVPPQLEVYTESLKKLHGILLKSYNCL